MKLFYSSTTILLTGLMFGLILSSTPAVAGKFLGKKKAAEISWDQCCEQNDNDTDKCQSMKNVTDKKQDIGTKSCPKPEVTPDDKKDDAQTEPEPDAQPTEEVKEKM